uniref:(northern house mosquito) hypothetical protein n=1 Tax=Culex pipiens TaxID=7175 RepID=A0A8D8CSZ5_CULPI
MPFLGLPARSVSCTAPPNSLTRLGLAPVLSHFFDSFAFFSTQVVGLSCSLHWYNSLRDSTIFNGSVALSISLCRILIRCPRRRSPKLFRRQCHLGRVII